jgi:hypothetical protein
LADQQRHLKHRAKCAKNENGHKQKLKNRKLTQRRHHNHIVKRDKNSNDRKNDRVESLLYSAAQTRKM